MRGEQLKQQYVKDTTGLQNTESKKRHVCHVREIIAHSRILNYLNAKLRPRTRSTRSPGKSNSDIPPTQTALYKRDIIPSHLTAPPTDTSPQSRH